MKGKVSVIIPNFNKVKFIAESLNSLLSQTYSNWEAIVIDDGSTDNSNKIIQEFQQKEKRIKPYFFSKQKNGGSVYRNFGLKKATGEYIIFFDSDDFMSPTCIEKRVKFMESNGELDFAVFPMGTFYKKIGDSGSIWKPQKEMAFELFLSHQLPWAICQPIFRKDFLLQNHYLFDESFARLQDVDFHTNLLKNKPNFEVVASPPDCFYRIDNNRKVFKTFELLEQYSNSISKYFKKYFIKKHKGYLDQSLLMVLSIIVQDKLSKSISFVEAQTLALNLISNTNGLNKFILEIYYRVALKLPFHMKGWRFICKLFIN